jgi:hypothetical protein
MTRYASSRVTRWYTACVAAQAICCLAHVEAALAQEPGQVTIDADRCREIASPDERLACFEKQVEDAQGRGAASPPPATVPPTGGGQQPIPTVDVAGLPAAGGSAEKPGQTEWVGTITELRQREPGQYIITLDGGSVWQQRGAGRYPLRIGQRVRIEESRLGIRLQADGVNGYIHVGRVR